MDQGNIFQGGALYVPRDRVAAILVSAPARVLRRSLAAAVTAVAIALALVLLPFMQWGLVVWYRLIRVDLAKAGWAEELPQHAELWIGQLHRRLRG